MNVRSRDICGVIRTHGSSEFICTKAPHVQLRLVLAGENARNIKRETNPHKFESRYPYRVKEN